jgi:hypothetical protein
VIYDDRALERRFAAGARVAEILGTLTRKAGAVPIADYAWEVPSDAGVVRHLRRVTPVGLIALREEAPASGGEAWAVRAEIVTLQQCVDIAIVRKESAGNEGFWELHVGDGNPRPVREPDLPAAFQLVRAALEATRTG